MTRRATTTWSQRGSTLLVTLPLALLSCGGNADTAAATAAATMKIASLIPEQTAAVIHIASLDTINQRQRSTNEAMGAPQSDLDFRDLLAMSPIPMGNTRLIDGTLPIVLVIGAQRGAPPTVAAIIPTTDPAAYSKSISDTATWSVADNYVVVTIVGTYKRPATPSRLLSNLKPGALSMYANLEPLTTAYKVIIDSGIDLAMKTMAAQMEQADASIDGEVIAEMYAELARAVVASAKTLNLAIDFQNGLLQVETSLAALPGSAMSGWSSPAIDLSSLAKGMTGKRSLEAVFQADMDKLSPHYNRIMERLIEIYPAESRQAMAGLQQDYQSIYEQIGSGMAIEGELFGGTGLQMLISMNPKDPARLMTSITKVMGNNAIKTFGLTATPAKLWQDGTTQNCDFDLTIDTNKMMSATGQATESQAPVEASQALQAMFGEGLAVRLAQREERVVIAIGKDREQTAKAAIEATEGSWSPAVRSALDRLSGCSPVVVERIDLPKMMSSVLATMASNGTKVPAIAKSASSNMLIYAGIQGDEWRGGLSFDVAGLGDIMQAMQLR